MLTTAFSKSFVRALHDALSADVDPAAGRHLAVHHQSLFIELVKDIPSRPLADEIRIRNQHTRSIDVSLDDSDRLSALYQ